MTTVEPPRSASDAPGAFSSYVPRAVRLWRPDPGEDGDVLEVEGTLLSADLSGFTALSEKLARRGREGAEELTDLLNTCFDGMIAAMDACAGDVLKFGGDALLVMFTGDGHAARACRAAVVTRALIRTPLHRRDGAAVHLRISQGMHSGRFLLCAVRGEHIEVLVTGPDATKTVVSESVAAAGEILLSAECAALVEPAWLGAPKEGGRLLRARAQVDAAALPQERRANGASGPFDPSSGGLTPYVPELQREQIAAGGRAEHRRATVGFLKFSHTDTLVEENGGAALARRLARLARAIARAEAAHSVHWLSTDIYADGGKCILTAGAPISTGHDEEAMLDALRDVLDADIDLDLSAGVHAGPVFAGDLGSRTRRTFTVMGDSVNLAARLMQKAQTGQLVASNAAAERTRGRFQLTPLEPFTVKGKSQVIHASIVGRREDARTHAADAALGIYGRDAELAQLRSAVERTREGSGSLIDLIGEAGSGKTRLLQELRRDPGLRSVGAICGQYARTSPYFAVRLLFRTLAGIDPLASSTEAGAQLERFVAATAPELISWLPLIAVPFDADVRASEEASRVAPANRRARIYQLASELLSAAVTEPTAFVIDDAHWMDDASRELIEALCGALPERPWLFCISRRPGAQLFETPSEMEYVRMELEPLPRAAALDLALAMAGNDAALRPDDWQRIVNHAGGNPLFVMELVSSAVERGSMDDVPDSVESIVTSRIDTLSAPDRAMLRDASVLGMVIDAELLADAVNDDTLRSAGRWERLDAFLAPLSPGVFTFRHELYRQTAYQGLSFRHRRELHRRVGEELEAREVVPGEDAELLSIHFARAGDHPRSWRYSVLAGDRARQKYANVESATLYRRALESARSLGDIEPAALVVVLESLGDVCELGARYDEAARAYAEARRRCSRAHGEGAASTLARLYRKSGAVDERLGSYVPALRWYGKGLGLLKRGSSTEERSARAQLALAYAGVRYRQGQYRELLRWGQEAARDAEDAGDRSTLAHAYFLLDLAYTSIGAPERGTFANRALAIFEEQDDYVGQSRSLNNMGISAWRSGDWDASFALFQRSRQAYELSGDSVGAAMAANNAAEILCDQGRFDDAIAMYRAALHTCKSARYPSGTAVVTGNLGQAVARSTSPLEGLEYIDESISLLSKIGATGYELEAAVKRTEALVLAGRFEESLNGSQQLLVRLTTNEEDVLAAMLQRQRAIALAGLGRMNDAMLTLNDSVERAQAAGADYELGRSLLARAGMAGRSDESGADDRRRGRALLERLGFVETA